MDRALARAARSPPRDLLLGRPVAPPQAVGVLPQSVLALAFTANSPLVGADRIVWASDYPHPDAKFPGVTDELREAMSGLTVEQQVQIAGESCRALYGI